MKKPLWILVVVVCALALPSFAESSPVKPGKWQVTVEMEMPGMAMKMPPTSFTHCVTKEMVDHPESTVPKAGKDQNCKVSDYKIEGKTVTWTMSCEGKQPMKGDGKIVYDGDAYDGVMHMKIGDMEMTQKYSGKRLGDCDQ